MASQSLWLLLFNSILQTYCIQAVWYTCVLPKPYKVTSFYEDKENNQICFKNFDVIVLTIGQSNAHIKQTYAFSTNIHTKIYKQQTKINQKQTPVKRQTSMERQTEYAKKNV